MTSNSEPSDEELAAEVEGFLSEMQKLEVRETFLLQPDQLHVAVGHDLHSEHKFMNVSFRANHPDENGVIPTFDVALDFEAANKLVNMALSVGYELWGERVEDDDDSDF